MKLDFATELNFSYLVVICFFLVWITSALVIVLAPPLCCHWKRMEEEHNESASNEDRLVVRFSDSSFEGKERTFSTITSDDLDTSHFEINDQSPNKMNDK